MEAWKPFRCGTYEASSEGGLRRAKPGIATFVGRPLKPVASPTGYAQVSLSLEGERGQRRLYVHRVIAEAFLGPCPPGHVVNHLDGNKHNNSLSNLAYVTPAENARHANHELPPRHRGPRKPRPPRKGRPRGDRHWTKRKPDRIVRGEATGSAKLTEAQVRCIKRRLLNGERQNVLAAEFGVSVAQLSRIARGTRWAHVEVSS